MATSVGMSATEVRECAEKLREDFLRAHSGNPDLDQRDIRRVSNTITYVEKFVRHNKGDHNKAFQHMVESLTWRKSFNLNDIKFEDIDEALWRSGMAMMHGYDATGQNIIVLNIAKHRKDSKKAPMLRKWIAYSFEMHQRVYPTNKMCMVFDMAGAGLSNMDMELVRFIVNSFKIYFPDLLQWLLVYNMPWILQAAWKIVQSWLSDGAAAKVKFVTNDTIQEYIPAHNLLTKFGGLDTWEFVFEVERENMMNMLREVEERESAEPGLVDESMKDLPQEQLVSSDEGAYDGEDLTPEGSAKQVRFASNLPPSRQSRFGSSNEEDSSYSNVGGNDHSLLKKGSATALGYRRRQVTRLMSLQENPREKESSHRERNGSLPVGSLDRQFEATGPAGVAVGDVILSPPHELVFAGSKDSDVFCTLTLKNMSTNSAAYKIKTTAPLRYKVRPNLSLIDPKSVAKVQVMLIKGSEIKTMQDKFLVQTHTFPDPETVPKLTDLPMYWKALPTSSVKEHRMRCRWMTDIASQPVISQRNSISSKGGSGSRTSPRAGATTARVVTAGGGGESSSGSRSPLGIEPEESVEQKIHKLVLSQGQLSHSLTQLQRLNYGIVAILVIVLLSIIFF